MLDTVGHREDHATGSTTFVMKMPKCTQCRFQHIPKVTLPTKLEVDYVIRVFRRGMFIRRLCVCPANSRRFHDFRPYNEDSRWPGWQVVIGIETHAQIRSRRKLFSGTPLARFISHLIDISPQILRRQRLMLLRIFTCHPLTLLFLVHSPCVLHNMNLAAWKFTHVGKMQKINPKCVDLAIRTALALKCQISSRSSFDRKHYFYSDLPSGFQITQHYCMFHTRQFLKLFSFLALQPHQQATGNSICMNPIPHL